MRDNVIVAYEKDGILLPDKLRLVVPGWWGYKWIKMLVGIELVNYDFKGTYESRGYPDNAEITTITGI
jgi:DMSO/TMAO reductase YedYZ molybdopterin-dependent catalytic subunit